MSVVRIYDCTLRDGCQGAGVSLSLQDKLDVARRLDEFGVDYIEGGWPGSNPKDEQFFAALRERPLEHARVTAFGSTRRPGTRARDDRNLEQLVAAETPAVGHGSLAADDIRELVAAHGFGLVLADTARERLPLRDDATVPV